MHHQLMSRGTSRTLLSIIQRGLNNRRGEYYVVKLGVLCTNTGSPEYLDCESYVLKLGVRSTWTVSPKAPDSHP